MYSTFLIYQGIQSSRVKVSHVPGLYVFSTLQVVLFFGPLHRFHLMIRFTLVLAVIAIFVYQKLLNWSRIKSGSLSFKVRFLDHRFLERSFTSFSDSGDYLVVLEPTVGGLESLLNSKVQIFLSCPIVLLTY